MNFSRSLILSLIFLLPSIFAFAQAPKESAQAQPTADDIRCEKMNSISLGEFKEKLVGNCNLNKPYSSSVSSLLNTETYFYCCHKK